MTRSEAYILLTKYLSNQNLLKHSIAAEAAMKGIYKYLHKDNLNPQDEIIWGITGLLHDADYELSKGMPDKHGILLFEKEPSSIPEEIAYAIQAHNPQTGIIPRSQLDWAIRSADQLTGLIVAATLVLPDKKIMSLTPESVLKRINEKAFAKGADREPIKLCESKLGIPLFTFIQIVLTSMKQISVELGL